jgi:hypothetical protein
MRGEAEKAPAEGMLFLTNIQQFYERADRNAEQEPEQMTAVLGSKPPTQKLELADFGDRQQRTVPLDMLDINATIAANHEHGIDLRIPADRNEISLSF